MSKNLYKTFSIVSGAVVYLLFNIAFYLDITRGLSPTAIMWFFINIALGGLVSALLWDAKK